MSARGNNKKSRKSNLLKNEQSSDLRMVTDLEGDPKSRTVLDHYNTQTARFIRPSFTVEDERTFTANDYRPGKPNMFINRVLLNDDSSALNHKPDLVSLQEW